MAAVDTETLQAEVDNLRSEVARLDDLVKRYMDIAAHWGTVNASLRKALHEMGYKGPL